MTHKKHFGIYKLNLYDNRECQFDHYSDLLEYIKLNYNVETKMNLLRYNLKNKTNKYKFIKDLTFVRNKMKHPEKRIFGKVYTKYVMNFD